MDNLFNQTRNKCGSDTSDSYFVFFKKEKEIKRKKEKVIYNQIK